jgi:hypothetical protein
VNRFRRILFALCMALAVVVGQQAVAMHDLAHATGQKHDSTPGQSTCDKCFACAELSSAVGVSIPPVSLPEGATEMVPAVSGAAACTAPLLAFRSRAPPSRS